MKINQTELERIRGRLIVTLGRTVSWSEFAKLSGVSLNTVSNWRHGKTCGSMQAVEKVVGAMRAKGLEVQAEDLLARK